MSSISAVIITFNEEKNIGECILSVKDIVDEIVVLDSGSTDKTCEIATGLGAIVQTHPFEGHIQQKNRARLLATKDWILSLDADERVSPELSRSIASALALSHFLGYTVNRLNHIGRKPIKTCGYYPDRKLRIWKREYGEWAGVNPHDRFELPVGSQIGHLTGDLLHYTYGTVHDMRLQARNFARIAANELAKKPTINLLGKLLVSGFFRFLRCYIFQAGFTDGRLGFLISLSQSREVYLKYYLALKIRMSL